MWRSGSHGLSFASPSSSRYRELERVHIIFEKIIEEPGSSRMHVCARTPLLVEFLNAESESENDLSCVSKVPHCLQGTRQPARDHVEAPGKPWSSRTQTPRCFVAPPLHLREESALARKIKENPFLIIIYPLVTVLRQQPPALPNRALERAALMFAWQVGG